MHHELEHPTHEDAEHAQQQLNALHRFSQMVEQAMGQFEAATGWNISEHVGGDITEDLQEYYYDDIQRCERIIKDYETIVEAAHIEGLRSDYYASRF